LKTYNFPQHERWLIMDNHITTSLTNKVEEQVKSECMAEGLDFQLIKKISLSENSEPTSNMLVEVKDVLEQSNLSLSVITRAVQNGLALKNVAPAYGALKELNKKCDNVDCFSLVSTRDYEEEMKAFELMSEPWKILSQKDSAHKTNCATIEEEIYNRFINTFRLENSSEIERYLSEVYKYGNHDRVDIAIETALKTNDELEDHNKGSITECLNVMKENCTKTRKIANAPKTRNTGVTGDDNTRIPHKDEAYRDKNKM